jgi:nucleoside-diphosphate-sugar epimerase
VIAVVSAADRGEPARQAGAEVVAADLCDPRTAHLLVPTVDAVVHAAQLRLPFAPSTREREDAVHEADRRMSEALAQACLARPSPPPFIYTSGIWSYGDHGERWIDETTEKTPPYASRGHHETAERLLGLYRDKGLPVMILLPGIVYGPVPSFESWFYRPLLAGQLRVVGEGMNFWSVIQQEDLGVAYALALEQPRPGEQLNIVDDEPLRVRDFYALIARCTSRPAPAHISPAEARESLGEPLTESMLLSTRVGNQKAKRELGWKPKYQSAHDGIPQAVEQIAAAQAPGGIQ